ncbi:Cysteine-rich repeat secretory protein 11 [Striga hermonthica]|uniref:Cysteine-rich repeat secretory protein 11 n=1 Tax=Striga hermonthica TaxID=68872 RepID=A0A9N7R7F7_STRHE|nr:Cysteine-rich repeat secretory protein 11 [Striga hermonthica]
MVLSHPSSSLILPISLAVFLSLASSSDYTNLVFKGCADQSFPDSDKLHSHTIKHLLDGLISQSSAAKFHNATSGAASSSAVDGRFQCRGDLSGDSCSACVRKASSLAGKLCRRAVAVRIQLAGCYLRYEASGFQVAGASELLFKICGPGRAREPGFGARLDAALGGMANGLEDGGGFYAGGYRSVYVLGQCEGDLGGTECVECVKNADDRAKSECGGSMSAQVYMQACFISYTYYPDGVPADRKSLSSSGGGRGTNSGKTVAIVMGGLVSVGLLTSCFLFTKSAFKKKTTTQHHTHNNNNNYGGG